jgi:two-component system response regulator MprA
MSQRVLLVDDDDDVRESVEAMIRRHGVEVSAARGGREALEELQSSEPPAVMLLDLMMPEVNGWAVRAQMLADSQLSRIPVVLVSGVADVVDLGKALQADAVLQKPVHRRELYELVDAYVTPRRAEDRRSGPKADGPRRPRGHR